MTALVLVPARLAATRLPDKPLADIAGMPMIIRVLRQAEAAGVGPVVVAAGDRAIVEAVEAAGGRAVLTDPALPSGSDRVHAAMHIVDPDGRYEIVVNVQGDLPDIDPATVAAAVEAMADPAVDIGTVAAPITDDSERADPNTTKAIIEMAPGGSGGRALYFSRATAPSGEGPLYHHIGIYAFRRAALDRFVALPPSVLEARERLEQLRALAAGMRIDVAIVPAAPKAVDTPADLEAARRRIAAAGQAAAPGV
ncbi:MAG: 3-deoxy-manno-octulosonate cytidylyltransferase [Azospirillaceae bacterium]